MSDEAPLNTLNATAPTVKSGTVPSGWFGPVASDAELLERLDINVISIVIGTLGYIVIVALIDVVKAGTAGAMAPADDPDDRYRKTKRKAWAALVVTLAAAFISILIYMWYRTYYGNLPA